MTIRLMRRIDYWVGVILCFLFSGINYIYKLVVFRKKRTTSPRKFLFIKLSEMGSVILAYPIIDKALKAVPGSTVFFLTFEKNKSLFQILEIIPYHNILTIREEAIYLFILDTLRAIKKIRREKIDIVFDLEFFSRFTALLTYLSGAPKRVGFYRYAMEGLYRGNFLTHKIQYNPHLHISKLYLSLWQTVSVKTKSTPELEAKIEDREISLPRYIPPEEARRRMWIKLTKLGIKQDERLLLLNPGEGNIPLREWPLENFITLTKMLLEDGNNCIIILGTQAASQKARLLNKSVNNKKCLDLTGKTTLSEVLSLCNIAQALIVNDSGLAHLASLSQIKKFIFFGPETPQVYSTLGKNTWIIYSNLSCSPCLSAFNHRVSSCRNNRCLQIIKPKDVYELIKACLYL